MYTLSSSLRLLTLSPRDLQGLYASQWCSLICWARFNTSGATLTTHKREIGLNLSGSMDSELASTYGDYICTWLPAEYRHAVCSHVKRIQYPALRCLIKKSDQSFLNQHWHTVQWFLFSHTKLRNRAVILKFIRTSCTRLVFVMAATVQ